MVASIQNNPGIAGYHFEVAADTSVFSVPKEDGELLVERGDFSKKGSVFANVNENGWEMLWYHTNNVTTDGALFRMTVTVSDDAAPGSTRLRSKVFRKTSWMRTGTWFL